MELREIENDKLSVKNEDLIIMMNEEWGGHGVNGVQEGRSEVVRWLGWHE